VWCPVITREVPEPYNSPANLAEENTGPVDNQIPERDEKEIPEPDTDELPEDYDEENIEHGEGKSPHYYKKEIPEPDTDELLEQYGKEYGEDETLESSRKPTHPSSLKREAKKPVTVSALTSQISTETVDDALFLSPRKQEEQPKSRVSKTRIVGSFIVLTAIAVAVYFIVLPIFTADGDFSAHADRSPVENTPVPEPTNGRTLPTTLAPSLKARVPLPTQLIPSGQKLYFQVQKYPVTSKISVIFAGSAGEGSIKSADIRVTHPDGSVATGIILPLKGVTEITLEGSKETDRVEIIAQMSSGGTYRVYDELVPLMR
jgi:hypothetical protein